MTLLPIAFEISDEKLSELRKIYSKEGKNSDIGNIAVEIAKLYFLDKYSNAEFSETGKGIDLTVNIGKEIKYYEIKGTEDKTVAFYKLKVSGKPCYDHLVNGKTEIMRITNIGNKKMKIYFLKHGKHFTLEPEDRWKFVEIK